MATLRSDSPSINLLHKQIECHTNSEIPCKSRIPPSCEKPTRSSATQRSSALPEGCHAGLSLSLVIFFSAFLPYPGVLRNRWRCTELSGNRQRVWGTRIVFRSSNLVSWPVFADFRPVRVRC